MKNKLDKIWNKIKKGSMFVWQRRSSFVFTIGSILYGCYHFAKPSILTTSEAYEALNTILGILSGRYFGLLFIVIGSFKLYGIITNNTKLRLGLYFTLVFLWLLIAFGFFVSFLQGHDNAAWIYVPIIVGLSTSIISTNSTVTGRGIDG